MLLQFHSQPAVTRLLKGIDPRVGLQAFLKKKKRRANCPSFSGTQAFYLSLTMVV